MSGKVRTNVFNKAKNLKDRREAVELINHYLKGKVSLEKLNVAQAMVFDYMQEHGMEGCELFITNVIMLARP